MMKLYHCCISTIHNTECTISVVFIFQKFIVLCDFIQMLRRPSTMPLKHTIYRQQTTQFPTKYLQVEAEDESALQMLCSKICILCDIYVRWQSTNVFAEPAEYMASDSYEFSSQGYMAGRAADPEPVHQPQQLHAAPPQACRSRVFSLPSPPTGPTDSRRGISPDLSRQTYARVEFGKQG